MPTKSDNRRGIANVEKRFPVEIITAFIGIIGIFFQQPFLLAIFLYIVVLFFFMRFMSRVYFSNALFSFGLVIPIYFGFYSYFVPDKILFIAFLVPLFSILYLLISKLPILVIDKFVDKKLISLMRKNRMADLEFLGITFAMFSVIVMLLSPIFYKTDLTTLLKNIINISISVFPYLLFLSVFIFSIFLIEYYFKLRSKINIKRHKLLFIFLILIGSTYIFFFLPIIVYPGLYTAITLPTEILTDQNMYFCKTNSSYNIYFYNSFDSNRCEITAYNQTNSEKYLLKEIILPKDKITMINNLTSYNQNITRYRVSCGIFNSDFKDIQPC